MDRSKSVLSNGEDTRGKKRKADEAAELEIDLTAPEPASKKALRKAKKSKHDLESDLTTATKSASSAGQPGGRTDFGIWIGNLSFSTTKSDLQTFLTNDVEHSIDVDKISRINLPANPVKHGKFQNKGFAYIDFADAETLEHALELSEKLLAGRRVLIKNSKNFEGRPTAAEVAKKDNPGHPPNTRIFVGNLGFDMTLESLTDHFKACGPVSNVHVATFEDSGKCKGYAWVEFEKLDSAKSAIRGWVEVAGSTNTSETLKAPRRRIFVNKIEGRKLRMEYAEDKTTRYNKRFGKSGGTQEPDQDEAGDVLHSSNDTKGAKPSSQTVQAADSKPKRFAGSERKESRNDRGGTGYAQSTVEKIRGSIVAGQGKKTTFD